VKVMLLVVYKNHEQVVFVEDTKRSNPLDNFRDERVTHYHFDPYQVKYIHSF